MGRMRWSRFLIPAGLCVLTVLVYLPIWEAGFVEYDDPAYVTENQYVTDGLTARGVRWAFTQEDLGGRLLHQGVGNLWHPVTWISHMIDAEVFGMEDATGHHAVNLFWHLVAVVLCYFCVIELGAGTLLAAGVAALFAVHPMRVESVAWISERKDVLSGAFFFGAFWCYLRGKSVLGLVLFAVALMAKPSVVVLPLLLSLVDWWRGKLAIRKQNLVPSLLAEVKKKWAWWALTAGAVVMTLVSQYGGTQGDFVTPLWVRILNMGPGLVFYWWRTVVPIDLSFHYPYPAFWMLAVGWLVIGALALSARWWPRSVWFGVLWFVILWLPVSGLAHVGTSFTADRYVYLAHVGLFFGLLKAIPKGGWLSLALAIPCAGLAFAQTKVWRSGETLFAHAVKAQPRDAVGVQNLGALYRMRGEHEAAIAAFERALELMPQDYIALANLGSSQWNLGQTDEAMANWKRAVEIYPKYLPAHVKLGRGYQEKRPRDLAAAEKHLRQAVTLSQGRSFEALDGLFKLLMEQGRSNEIPPLVQQLPPDVQSQIQLERR